MSTLVVCVDREGGLGHDGPIVGWEAIQALVTDVGVDDPEDSRVNCLLETLRVARDLRDGGEEAVVAVVSGGGDGVNSDRTVARQTDQLVADYDPESAIVVTDSASDERLIPIIESRVQVDAVDRVVVRQSHDIQSTYYLLKQFLADEELRGTVLVPIGAALLAFPVLLLLADSVAVALSAIAAVIGTFLLYKGLGIDDFVSTLPRRVQDAFYSGQMSLVTYVVGAGLALVGIFAGGISATSMGSTSELLVGLRFVFDSVPWFAAAALAAATGRLIDELLAEEGVSSALMNLPFGVVAVGLVVRGFTGYFLERSDVIEAFSMPPIHAGPVFVEGFILSIWGRLALYVAAGILVSFAGVAFTSRMSEADQSVEEFPE
ncbi:MAG: putative membrane protein [Natronomonas sp.]